jgi:uncharacterized protein YdhG (YjbR/CyaY superfamily)
MAKSAKPASTTSVTSVEEYMAALPALAVLATVELRSIIRSELPDAVEVISYGIPTFKLGKPVVAFGGWNDFCSLYTLSGDTLAQFEHEIQAYDSQKSTLRFKFDQPLPVDLIRRIIQARLKANAARGR